jgi:hypothetical protein
VKSQERLVKRPLAFVIRFPTRYIQQNISIL